MAQICRYEYSSKDFNYHGMSWTTEASDLARNNFFGQIWDDAADVGFVVKSHVTGKEVVFYLDTVERDADNDIRWWTFKPYNPEDRYKDLVITIWND